MASANPFDLLLDDDSGDTSALLAAVELKLAAKSAASTAVGNGVTTKPAKMPSKPLPPTQAVRESRNEGGRGRGGRDDRGYVRGGRGGGGFNRNRENSSPNENGFSVEGTGKPYEKRSGFDVGHSRGGRRGGFSNGDTDGERPRRNYERHSGTGRGSEIKRDGAGRGNWGTTNDDIAPEVEEAVTEIEINVSDEKPAGEEEKVDVEKESKVNESEEKEPEEEKQMTYDEYQKVLEEKRKALLSLSEEKGEQRKVDVKEFDAMHLVSKKKNDDEVFIKLGSEKDKKREAAEKEEKAKKSVSISEFLKPADGEGYYRSGGRGRGRGRDNRGGRGGYNGGGGYPKGNIPALEIEDKSQFPTLGGK